MRVSLPTVRIHAGGTDCDIQTMQFIRAEKDNFKAAWDQEKYQSTNIKSLLYFTNCIPDIEQWWPSSPYLGTNNKYATTNKLNKKQTLLTIDKVNFL